MNRPYVIHFTTMLMVLILTLIFTCSGLQIPGNFNNKNICLNLKAGDKGYLQLTTNDEPGEPLVIYGKVIDRKTKQPINDVSVFLYQTDSAGIYNRLGGPDEQAKIRGILHTNERGCFKIKTILPGDYPGQKNSRHIHYIINAEGYREIKSLFFFKGFTTPNITSEGPLAILHIKKDEKGIWIATIEILMNSSDN